MIAASAPIVWIYLYEKPCEACLEKLLLTVRTRLCGEFKYIVHKHIQQAANGTGLAADQAGSKTNIVHVCVFRWAQLVFQMAEPDTWHYLAYTSVYQKVSKSGCGVSLRIRGPERLKLKSFRWILGSLVLRRSQVITCANGAHLWPVWSSMLIPFFTRFITFKSILRFKYSDVMNLFWFASEGQLKISNIFKHPLKHAVIFRWHCRKCSQDKLDRTSWKVHGKSP